MSSIIFAGVQLLNLFTALVGIVGLLLLIAVLLKLYKALDIWINKNQ